MAGASKASCHGGGQVLVNNRLTIVASAAIPSSGDGVIHACFLKRGAAEKGGAELRVFDDEKNPNACQKSDRELSFVPVQQRR